MEAVKTHDALNRRRRDTPVSTGKRFELSERDYLWFEAIQRHGPLSSSFLREYSASLGFKDTDKATKRLGKLYHEADTIHGGPYLDRPWEQDETTKAHLNDRVYDLTPASEFALKEAKRFFLHTPARAGSWKHTYMVAALTSSIELETLKHPNYRYIFQDEILGRASASLSISGTFIDPKTKRDIPLKPDALFGIEYHFNGKKTYRFFLVEADRNKEPNRFYSFNRKSYERSIRQYQTLLGTKLYKKHFDMTAPMMVLNITTSETHMDNLRALTREILGDDNKYMLFSFAPQFGRYFKPPKPLSFLFGPYRHAGDGHFDITQP